MTRQAEGRLVKRILDYLNSLPGVKAIKIHGGAFSESGTPDIFAVRNGHAYLFEVKTSKGKASEIQLYRLVQWQDAGAVTALVRSIEEVERIINDPTVAD